MNIDDMEQDLLADYGRLHDGISEMVESGRLTASDIPDDYDWLVSLLAELATASDRLNQALEEECS
jgi:hypothetical protein